MSTKFILSAQKDTLPPSPTLSLLPFSLGPTNAPYKATGANISGYFCPRPIAAPVGNQSEGQDAHAAQNLQATFRGRRLVGQELALPPSYRGVILSTTLPPNKGGTEDHSASYHTPLTPTASTASVAPTEVSADGEENLDTGKSSSRPQRKSVLAKIKGAGQIALSRPRMTRSKRPEPKKRVRLDSDDEDELEAPVEAPKEAKRPRISPSTPGKPLDVPEITIQEPTPLKASTSTTPSSLRQLRSGTPTASPRPSSVIERELPSLTEEGEEGAGDGADAVSVEVQEVEDQNEDMEEQVIPSPATEDALPTTPTFNVPPPPIESPDKEAAKLATATEKAVNEEHEDVEMKEEADAEEAYGGPVRLLRPTATFDRFVLYTGDAPLAGFRADELKASSAPTEPPAEPSESPAPAPAGDSTIDGGIQVRPSWWRLGGSGEGGDEFVRGMGEWLGLVESLNKPVYLDGIEDDDVE
ncbi:hypothetical protein I350_00351 [Cryptococcus amylolentus CBS 6273]|uniref:Uncharacterized protein n=1 Tax=Cryptococcus amylolentus CBS 6273 TaxID=1296118 RepID=A0A1E3KER2_9TREE|nr:hypothetical protein I350_00351 [Cryptococcus amylolentus CBS 6273]